MSPAYARSGFVAVMDIATPSDMQQAYTCKQFHRIQAVNTAMNAAVAAYRMRFDHKQSSATFKPTLRAMLQPQVQQQQQCSSAAVLKCTNSQLHDLARAWK